MRLAVVLPFLTAQLQPAPPQANAVPSQADEPRIAFGAPPFDLPPSLRDSVRFGYLDVPQDHADPAGRTLRLALAVLPALSGRPAAEPVVFIPGGPGMSTVVPWTAEAARSPRIALLRERRDFIILDPRGHGLSEPRTCPELDRAEPLVDDSPTAEAILSRKLSACRMRLAEVGILPELLDAVQAAYDVDLLRRALGAERVNLLGASYGTRIVAEAMRRMPRAIRSAALISPVPPGLPHLGDDADVAPEVLAALFRRCAEVSDCLARYPRLEADYDSVLARARRGPLRAPLPASDRAPEGHVVFDDRSLGAGVAQLLTSRSLAGGVPMMIHLLAVGGFGPVADMAPQLMALLASDDVAFGTNLAFHCNDGPVGVERVAWLPERCPPWVGAAYGDPAGEPLRSEIPALVMVGEWDPRTPPSYARYLANGLTRAHVVEVPWHGHDLQHPCLSRMQRDFFEAPETAPDVACLDSIAPVRFVPPVVRSRWIARAVMDVRQAPWRTGGAGAPALLLLVAPVVGLPVQVIRARSRRSARALLERSPRARLQAMSLWLASAAALALLLGVAGATLAGARSHVLVPAFGVPHGWSWVLVMPWATLTLFVCAVALAFSGRPQPGSPTALLRLSGFLGTAIVLVLWAAHSLS
jgi:pimeloyl-ACP methyl ester carboxylesterase